MTLTIVLLAIAAIAVILYYAYWKPQQVHDTVDQVVDQAKDAIRDVKASVTNSANTVSK